MCVILMTVKLSSLDIIDFCIEVINGFFIRGYFIQYSLYIYNYTNLTVRLSDHTKDIEI